MSSDASENTSNAVEKLSESLARLRWMSWRRP